MSVTYNDENNVLLQNFMEKTYFHVWKTLWKKNVDNDTNAINLINNNEIFYGNYSSLELQLNSYCDLDCLYCYEQKYGETYFPNGTGNKKTVLHNTQLILDFLYKNKMFPHIEIFSGDPLVQSLGHDVIEKIIEMAEDNKKITNSISIPTNMSFLLHPDKKNRIELLMDRAQKVGIRISLSASVDGKYMEMNRPFKRSDKFKRDDAFYDDLFSFAKKYGTGFHPMLYSNNIKMWKQNFLWFQEQFEKYKIRWDGLYLLEVRNVEWSNDELYHLYDFLRWLVHWTFNKLNKNVNDYLLHNRVFNILNAPFGTSGRGIGCSIQSTLQLRVGDLSWAMCHRLMYDKYQSGKFIVENDEITGKLESYNVESFIGLQASDVKSFPNCESCSVKHLCHGGCLGSNYESTGDPYTTHPIVCQVEHYKILGILQGLADTNLLVPMMARVTSNKQISIQNLINAGLIKFNEEYNWNNI